MTESKKKNVINFDPRREKVEKKHVPIDEVYDFGDLGSMHVKEVAIDDFCARSERTDAKKGKDSDSD
jgi:hypothetical protein